VSQPYQARIGIRRHGEELRASWLDGGGQESPPFTLTLPLTRDDARDLRWYLETFIQFPGYGDRARAQRLEARMKEWGGRAFQALFTDPDAAEAHQRLLAAAAKDHHCLLTLATTEPDVLGQPWELVRNDRGPLACQGVTIRRQLVGAKPVGDRDLSPPLHVLLIVSRPKDTGFIDPRNSIAPLLDALDVLPEGTVTIDFCDPPTLAQLEEMISDAREGGTPYHIVHFDGHGTFFPRSAKGALAFEKPDETTDLVAGQTLGDLLARLDVPLVLLEACRTSDLSDKPVFGSVAPALLQSGVGSVIAFSHSVHVEATKLFVERFYKKLAAGKTVGQALAEARTRLHAERARWLHLGPSAETVDLQDWFIPQLYQVGDDPALFAAVKERADREPARDGVTLLGFPPPPLYRFHGRAQELLDLERAFRRHPALVLSGGGGMGKTALSREAAHWWRRTGRFDHAVFCSFEQKAGAENVIQVLGKALEGDGFSSRSAEEQWQTAVKLFRGKRVLLVWDNFESTLPIYQQGEQADSPLVFSEESRLQLRRLYGELTAGEPRGRLLVTCRPDDTLLPGIEKVSLSGLARADSLHLLAAVLARGGLTLEKRPGYERHEVDDLLTMLADHPLSISLVAPHFRTLTPQVIREEFHSLVDRFKDDTAPEGRNRSLLASLEFSKRHLSPEARRLLPYLAWFEGGVFEQFLLAFADLTSEAWVPLQSELVATALVTAEKVEQVKTPYLRFHPTLPHAARPGEVPNAAEAEQRFIAVYRDVMRMAEEVVHGGPPAAGMALLAREEANCRSAIARAFRCGSRHDGWRMAETLRLYLERSGRLREREALVAWVHAQVADRERLDEATCHAIRDHADSRSQQGHAAEAVQMVQDLIRRLESEGLRDDEDPAFQLALTRQFLGRIYDQAGRPDLALGPLRQAIAGFERLAGDAARANLAAALGDLALASMDLRQSETALQAAERSLAISREMGSNREIAAGLGQVAAILMQQQRYTEADARYGEALLAAREVGDERLQAAILTRQGARQDDLGNPDRAVALYQQALALFQRAGDRGSEMKTCDLLGSAEIGREQLEAAEAWYRRAGELARQLNDRAQLAHISENLGVLYQRRAAHATGAESRMALLRQAIDSVQHGLAIRLEMHNQVGAASSYVLLGGLHGMLGELDQAEAHLQQALQIDEALNVPEVWKVYAGLAFLARDRGDQEAAARWQAKYDAKLAELERLRRG
jgi:tetratricopeptide (TPR) repeat protein